MTERRYPGENLFEEYLNLRKLKFSYESAIGRTKPDYSVYAKQEVLVELESFGETAADRAFFEELKAGQIVSRSGFDYERIRKRIKAGADQLKPYRGKFPCVVALFNPGYPVNLTHLNIKWAMFGGLAIEFQVGSDFSKRPRGVRSIFTGEGARMQPEQHRGVSAVAVLSRHTPGQAVLDSAARKYLRSRRTVPWGERHEGLFKFLEEFEKSNPHIDFAKQVPKLTVIHNNLFADIPLDPSIFNGPHDENWVFDATGAMSLHK